MAKYSNDLSYIFGMSSTFSISNVNYMKKFYCCFPVYIDMLNKLSFEHYKILVDIRGLKERNFYFRVAMFCRSSVVELKEMVKDNTYLLI